VVLRDFRSSDRDDFVALVDDEAMFEFMKFRLDETSAAQKFDLFVTEPHTNPRRIWDLVIESPTGEFAGWAGLDGRNNDDEAEVGWYLPSRHWGRGYATEATRLLIDFGCGTLGYRRLFATADPANAASRRVIEKTGLSYVGVAQGVRTWQGVRPRVMYEWMCPSA
jgi:RimJ/RimL family protein N-acetyltransferase